MGAAGVVLILLVAMTVSCGSTNGGSSDRALVAQITGSQCDGLIEKTFTGRIEMVPFTTGSLPTTPKEWTVRDCVEVEGALQLYLAGRTSGVHTFVLGFTSTDIPASLRPALSGDARRAAAVLNRAHQEVDTIKGHSGGRYQEVTSTFAVESSAVPDCGRLDMEAKDIQSDLFAGVGLPIRWIEYFCISPDNSQILGILWSERHPPDDAPSAEGRTEAERFLRCVSFRKLKPGCRGDCIEQT
ncbi:MAG: hypothetical protein AB7I38_03960 [Dehalococcoidia bacterium]